MGTRKYVDIVIAILFLLIIGVFMYRTTGMVSERFGKSEQKIDSLDFAIKNGENEDQITPDIRTFK